MQSDRRRLNAPSGGTSPPVYLNPKTTPLHPPSRTRDATTHRKIFLRTGVVPSASGSAYYELSPSDQPPTKQTYIFPTTSTLKISCTVHGPRPLPRTAAFSPNLLLTTHLKFAPFATRVRRGYVRDASERDLGVHLETALRGVVIGERWPKSAAEVVITILEGEEDGWWGEDGGQQKQGGWGLMSVLAGCITVASAALVDAGIDCVDLVSGGVAAVVRDGGGGEGKVVLDPCPAEHRVKAACVVGYLQARDEITEIWMKGDAGDKTDVLMDEAVKAAAMTRTVLAEAVKEGAELKGRRKAEEADAVSGKKIKGKDVDMTG